jgi:type I restriction enzyme M protein
LQSQENVITVLEKRVRESKTQLKNLTDELEHKLQLKRLGADEFKADSKRLLCQVDTRLAGLDENKKDDKKKINALEKDKATLQARIARTNALLLSIGGQLTEAEAKTLILKKLYDIAYEELARYLNAEKRRLFAVVENLWDKYAVSSQRLEADRDDALRELNAFLKGLSYV